MPDYHICYSNNADPKHCATCGRELLLLTVNAAQSSLPKPMSDEQMLAWLDAPANHYYCEDTWYSCPKHPEGCADDRESACNCGAEVDKERRADAAVRIRTQAARITESGAQQNPPEVAPSAAPDAQTPSETPRTDVLQLVLEVARAAFLALEDCEERDNREYILDSQSFNRLSAALNALDALPELPDPFIGSGPAKAEYMLSSIAPLEREVAELRLQLAEAQDFVTAADEQVHFHGMAKERAEIRAETAEADARELWNQLPTTLECLEKHRAKYGSAK